jgi:hypothetical protein
MRHRVGLHIIYVAVSHRSADHCPSLRKACCTTIRTLSRPSLAASSFQLPLSRMNLAATFKSGPHLLGSSSRCAPLRRPEAALHVCSCMSLDPTCTILYVLLHAPNRV